jgi:hypothetical protein
MDALQVIPRRYLTTHVCCMTVVWLLFAWVYVSGHTRIVILPSPKAIEPSWYFEALTVAYCITWSATLHRLFFSSALVPHENRGVWIYFWIYLYDFGKILIISYQTFYTGPTMVQICSNDGIYSLAIGLSELISAFLLFEMIPRSRVEFNLFCNEQRARYQPIKRVVRSRTTA